MMNKAAVWALLITALFLPHTLQAGPVFEESRSLVIGSRAPVLNEDVHRAHRQALDSGFRRALIASLPDLEEKSPAGSRILEDPGRYIRAYQIEEQSRRDLYYLLKLSVWVDLRLLREAYRREGETYRMTGEEIPGRE